MHSVTMFFSCLSYFWGNDGVIGAAEFLIYVLYIGKHSRENTFTNFAVLWYSQKFLSEIWDVASFNVAKVTKLSPWKSYFSLIRKSFLPRKFSTVRYPS